MLAKIVASVLAQSLNSRRYTYVATEVLCSEIWSIVDTCVNHPDQLLLPFWETVLDKSPDEMRSQVMMASHFAKVNVAFLSKKPAEVNTFISCTLPARCDL